MTYLFEPLHYAFMQRAFAEALLMALVCGPLGVFVVTRGLTFTGESLSHTLLPGAAIALAAALPVLAGALVGGVLSAVLIALLLRRPQIGEDAAVSVVFTGAFAIGVVVLSTHGSPKDLDSLLFGSILAVSPGDLRTGAVAALAVLVLMVVLARPLVVAAFDRPFAAAAGLRPGLVDVVLLIGVAAALTVALRGIGTLLVLALLVAPAVTARLFARSIWSMLWLAPLVAAACAIVGLELSYHAGAAAGPAIALAAVSAAVFAVLVRAAATTLSAAA
jgi:ABC-type Mn2+/Zn2+ transport system permease subunit